MSDFQALSSLSRNNIIRFRNIFMCYCKAKRKDELSVDSTKFSFLSWKLWEQGWALKVITIWNNSTVNSIATTRWYQPDIRELMCVRDLWSPRGIHGFISPWLLSLCPTMTQFPCQSDWMSQGDEQLSLNKHFTISGLSSCCLLMGQ